MHRILSEQNLGRFNAKITMKNHQPLQRFRCDAKMACFAKFLKVLLILFCPKYIAFRNGSRSIPNIRVRLSWLSIDFVITFSKFITVDGPSMALTANFPYL